jgi:hypothetical protein
LVSQVCFLTFWSQLCSFFSFLLIVSFISGHSAHLRISDSFSLLFTRLLNPNRLVDCHPSQLIHKFTLVLLGKYLTKIYQLLKHFYNSSTFPRYECFSLQYFGRTHHHIKKNSRFLAQFAFAHEKGKELEVTEVNGYLNGEGGSI